MRKVIKNIYRKIIKLLPLKVGIYIDYIRTHRKFPNLKNPITFSEKMQYIKVNGYLEKYKDLVDKYIVRDYVENKIGKKYLNELIGVYVDINDFKLESLPDKFVLKLNNGSGFNFICKDKELIDEKKLKKTLKSWLKKDFYKENKEIQYKDINNKIICENYLEDDSGELRDYKFFCFNGRVDFIQVDNNRFTRHRQNMYDINWNIKELNFGYTNSEFIDKKPEKISEMIEIAEILSEDIPFVRIDLYYVNEKIYFGEFTFTPQNGLVDFKPIYEDQRISNMIDLELYK